jgi:carbonic anhydrase/acetyltransferase-like protein (isoleucine patch superfamily)
VIHVNTREATVIEDDVLIGHGAVLEGCHIGQGALIGMHATVLSGAQIGAHALIAAGSLVREGSQVPAGALAAGVPAVVRGELPTALQERIRRGPIHYQENALRYRQSMKIVG